MREHEEKTVVLRLATIPDDGSIYWVGGVVILRNGREMTAVFTTTGRGELHASFWRVGEQWISSDDPRLPTELDLPRTELFPFDFRFNVPAARDAFH